MIKLSYGNKKTGDGLFIFNLPAGKTCIGATAMCSKKCYAKKTERLYKNVRQQRENNLIESKKETFVDEMSKAISSNLFITYFRIHESGDFYNQDILNKWIEIAKRNKRVNFLAYTKSFNLDFSKVPKNLKIIMSLFPDSPEIPENLQNFSIAYAGNCENMRKSVHCIGQCSACLKCWHLTKKQNVHFEFH